jgi:phospholipid-translocating ATPase
LTCTDLSFVLSTRFIWKVSVIVLFSAGPLYLIKVVRERLAPANYVKVSQY